MDSAWRKETKALALKELKKAHEKQYQIALEALAAQDSADVQQEAESVAPDPWTLFLLTPPPPRGSVCFGPNAGLDRQRLLATDELVAAQHSFLKPFHQLALQTTIPLVAGEIVKDEMEESPFRGGSLTLDVAVGTLKALKYKSNQETSRRAEQCNAYRMTPNQTPFFPAFAEAILHEVNQCTGDLSPADQFAIMAAMQIPVHQEFRWMEAHQEYEATIAKGRGSLMKDESYRHYHNNTELDAVNGDQYRSHERSVDVQHNMD